MEDELMGMVLQLAGWIEGVAPEVWAIMVRQSIVNGVQNAFWSIVILMAIIFCIKQFKKYLALQKIEDNSGKYSCDRVDYTVLLGLLAGGIGIGVIAIIATTSGAISYLLNPQYYALQGIIALFK